MRRVALGTALVVGASALTAAQPLSVARAEPGASSYVVIYRDKPTVSATAGRLSALGVRASARFGRAVHGFAAQLTDEQRTALAADPRVARIEPNIVIRAANTQVDPPWGLDRLDQGTAAARLDQSYSYGSAAQGATTNIYVIDTGIRSSHGDFTGRVQPGRNFVPHADPNEALPNANTSDCNGHGTHVAGTAAGTTSGVAKAARIVPVRVLDCNGESDLASVLAGIDWVITHKQLPGNAGYEAVANFSLGGFFSQALNDAVTAMTAADIAVAVAAGNESDDLNNYSPASETTSVTVGAVNSVDVAASFSNWGSGLDVWAPGVAITSAWYESNTQLATVSGTSMAAPHVAGVMAVLRSVNPEDLAYANVNQVRVADRLAGLTRGGVSRPFGDTVSGVRLLQSPAPGSQICTSATGFTATTAGSLRKLRDPSVLTGTSSLVRGAEVGTGWTTGSYAWIGHGGDGVVYLITRSGDLRWYRYDEANSRWMPGSGTRIGTGWNVGTTLRSVEISRDGKFYTVDSGGTLRLYRHRGRLTGAQGWSSWTIGTGWRSPQVLAPNGDGTLYRQYGGTLYWYRHSDPSAGPVSWQGGRAIGGGWSFTDLVPLGGGVLYGVTSGGVVRSYRNTGYVNGRATWDALRLKGSVQLGLGTVLNPYTCTN